MRVRSLKRVEVRGPHPLAGSVVDVDLSIDDQVVLTAAGQDPCVVRLAAPPVPVRWGFVLITEMGSEPVHLVQCVECLEAING